MLLNLLNRKIIITAGPTREWIDPVRFISNPSTGKMGIALADAAKMFSKDVRLIHGNINESLLKNCDYWLIPVESTIDMLEAVKSELTHNSILIMAAAPGDYRVKEISSIKIKKKSEHLSLDLIRNPDILKNVAEIKKTNNFHNLFTVGFAAETHDILNYGEAKLVEKDLDMICINDVSNPNIGFASDNNSLTILTRSGLSHEILFESKTNAAKLILNMIDQTIVHNKN